MAPFASVSMDAFVAAIGMLPFLVLKNEDVVEPCRTFVRQPPHRAIAALTHGFSQSPIEWCCLDQELAFI
ncbi:hypothetical protein PC120_g11599 [Phytophthora cactorum]|nr:hypothetical protein PC120_g11599 [Phytophthora cactorum]